METKPQKVRSKGASAFAVIVGCAIVAFAFFYLYCGLGHFWQVGSPASLFDAKGHPLNGNPFATLYQGGFVIPIVMTLLLTVFALSVERYFALNKANGKGSVTKFVANAKTKLDEGDIKGAEDLCDKQEGSVANVLKSALLRYKDVESYTGMNNDEKAAIIQQELEDATTLELPYLEQNLPVIAAISSLGTLFGLLGTVLGMIKSFGAMANEGAPDSTVLALGISEALMNTAMGIGTGACAIISYNYFAGRVKDITDAINEVGFAIGQTYTKKHN